MAAEMYVIPLKRGSWRTVKLTPVRHRAWEKAWGKWYAAKGHRLAISPEMWEPG
jgi:hypothetical protein